MGIDRGFNSVTNHPDLAVNWLQFCFKKKPRSWADRDRNPPWTSSEDRGIDSTLKD